MPVEYGNLPEASNISRELNKAGNRSETLTQAAKKNYAETLSRALAQRFANELRAKFPGIKPDEHGGGQESNARTAKGVKKLDVNYSTPELGLGLGLSIKTINFRDPRTKRYTKNYTRADGELRAESSDYHERQPYAVMVAVVFIPFDACDDGSQNAPSSFGQAVRIFRTRAGRGKPKDEPMLFERVFVGLYDTGPRSFGRVGFFDVMLPPPRIGYPAQVLSLAEVCNEVLTTYDARNSPPFVWADGGVDQTAAPILVDDTEE